MHTTTESRDRSAELLARLKEETERLRTSDGWQRWLRYAARFHTYSLGNQLLIARQRPDATQVAGYRAWQHLGRQVRAGERGIAILAPNTRTIADEESGEKRHIVTGFRVTHVFDVDQTSGDDLPALTMPDVTGDADVLYKRVVTAAERDGLTVEVVTKPQNYSGPRGWYTPEQRMITLIDAGSSLAARTRTALHEFAHHCDPAVHDVETRGCTELLELVAESAAFIVGTGEGLDMKAASVTYVASWGGWDQFDADSMEQVGQHVLAVARTEMRRLSDVAGSSGH